MPKFVEFADVRIPWTPELQALLDLVGWGRKRGGSFDEYGRHTSLIIETSDGDEVTIDVVEVSDE